eukprot:COSAG06_NODE_30011_length_546_cov_1.241611_1_plen_135_part_01
MAGAPHRFARCYCVFFAEASGTKGCLLKLLSAGDAFVLSLCPWRPISLDLLFSSPRPFQGRRLSVRRGTYRARSPTPFATTGMPQQQPPAPSHEEGVPPLAAAAAAARAAEGEQVWEDLNEPEPVTKQSFVDVSV